MLSATRFRASYQGEPILDALRNNIEGGQGQYLAVTAWELELMLKLQLSEAEYSRIPVGERARKIAAMKINEWIEILESDRHHKEWVAKNARR